MSKFCVTNCVTKKVCVCDKDVCGRWCVTKFCETNCVTKKVRDKDVCGRWCVTKFRVTKMYVEDGA